MIISVVINADTRRGYLTNDKSSIGDYAPGGQEGARSIDFLLEGVKNKMDFFRGYKTQCILYIDKHEELPNELHDEIYKLVMSYGNDSKLIIGPHNRIKHRWYDYIYIDALKEADGDYVAHFDTDTTAFRTDESDIVERYIKWLDEGYKYICYPTEEQPSSNWWSSTRFFITKRETMNLNDAENCIHNEYLAQHYGRMRYDPFPCCWEHTAALMQPEGSILYPSRQDDEYMIFCWVTYFKGVLPALMKMSYRQIKEIVIDKWGIYGANDVVSQPL